ncbi:hypothetical protein ACTXT7_006147 [Hymenolepis weldensis]
MHSGSSLTLLYQFLFSSVLLFRLQLSRSALAAATATIDWVYSQEKRLQRLLFHVEPGDRSFSAPPPHGIPFRRNQGRRHDIETVTDEMSSYYPGARLNTVIKSATATGHIEMVPRNVSQATNAPGLTLLTLSETSTPVTLRRKFPFVFLITDVQKPIIGANFLSKFHLLANLKDSSLHDNTNSPRKYHEDGRYHALRSLRILAYTLWSSSCGAYKQHLRIDDSSLGKSKSSKSRTLSKDNRLSLLSSLIESSIRILKDIGDISPPHQITLRLVDFLLRYHEKIIPIGISLKIPRTNDLSSQFGLSQAFSQNRSSILLSLIKALPIVVAYHKNARSKTLTDLNSNSSNRRGVSLLPGRLVKSRSTIFNSVEVIEQTLRLVSTLLPPNVCYTIAYFSSALINIYCCIGEDISTRDFYPLCNPEYLSKLMTPVLFPTDSERTKTGPDTNRLELLLVILFSSSPTQNVHPPKLLQDLVDLSNPPSSLKQPKKIKENAKNSKKLNETKSSILMKSALSRLNVQSPSLSPSSPRPLKAIHPESTPKISAGSNNKNATSSIDLISELATKKGLMNLLNSILVDQSIDLKTKYGYLTQFRQNHSEIFLKRFTNKETADAYMDRMLRKVSESSKNHSSINPSSKLSKAFNKLSWSKATSKTTK